MYLSVSLLEALRASANDIWRTTAIYIYEWTQVNEHVYDNMTHRNCSYCTTGIVGQMIDPYKQCKTLNMAGRTKMGNDDSVVHLQQYGKNGKYIYVHIRDAENLPTHAHQISGYVPRFEIVDPKTTLVGVATTTQ